METAIIYNIVCFYPKRALQKVISKSTAVRSVIALANRKHVRTFDNFICNLCLFLHLFSNFLNKLHANLKDK